MVTDFRLHQTCSIIILWLHSLSGVIRSLLCNLRAFRQGIIIIIVCANTSMCTSYVHTHIYIADIRTKEVSKCTVTSERSVFLVKIANSNVMNNHVYKHHVAHVACIPLVSVFWGSGVVSGIRGKQMTPLLLNEAFLAKITIIKVFPVLP